MKRGEEVEKWGLKKGLRMKRCVGVYWNGFKREWSIDRREEVVWNGFDYFDGEL